MTETYRRLETPKIYAVVETESIDSDANLSDGDLTDVATSIKIIIANEAGAIVQPLDDMDNDSEGKYHYDGYTIAADALTGTYRYEIRATDTTKVSVVRGKFNVEEQLA